MSLKFIKPERLLLLNHPEYREVWVQQRIAEDPSILGLGDLVLKDKERIQPRGGRLDLLLQDAESSTRYEVEVMLGSAALKPLDVEQSSVALVYHNVGARTGLAPLQSTARFEMLAFE
jgi:hypothetical protein